jgi:hypothetical protein
MKFRFVWIKVLFIFQICAITIFMTYEKGPVITILKCALNLIIFKVGYVFIRGYILSKTDKKEDDL